MLALLSHPQHSVPGQLFKCSHYWLARRAKAMRRSEEAASHVARRPGGDLGGKNRQPRQEMSSTSMTSRLRSMETVKLKPGASWTLRSVRSHKSEAGKNPRCGAQASRIGKGKQYLLGFRFLNIRQLLLSPVPSSEPVIPRPFQTLRWPAAWPLELKLL